MKVIEFLRHLFLIGIVLLPICVLSRKTHGTILDTYYNHPRGGIYKVDSSGEVSSVLPDSATGLTFDGDGNLYYSTYSHYTSDLMMMSPDQEVTYLATIFDDPDPVIALKAWNIDVAVNNSGEVYYNHPRGGIYKVDSSGEVSSVLSDSPTGLTFDGDGNLHYSTYGRYKGDLTMMSPDQQVTYLATLFDDPGSIALKHWNIDVAVNNSGEVYYNHPRGGIYKVDSSGEVSSVLPDSATGLAFDGDGNLYYCAYGRYKGDLMMMSPDQQVTYLATLFDDPGSIALKAWNIDVATIPEPTTLSLLTLGALSLLRTRRA